MSDQYADLKRQSPWLKGKTSSGKTVVRMAQDLIAKKWGITPPYKSLDDITLKQYLEVYKKPLSESAMNAVSKLTKVAVNKKKIKGQRKEIKGKKGKKEVKTGRKKSKSKESKEAISRIKHGKQKEAKKSKTKLGMKKLAASEEASA
jgi:hypothetical protein